MRIKLHHILLFLVVVAVLLTCIKAYSSKLSMEIRELKHVNMCLLSLDEKSNVPKLRDVYLIQYLPAKRALKVIVISKNVRYTTMNNKTERLRETFASAYRQTQDNQKAITATINRVQQIFNNAIDIPFYCAGTDTDYSNLLDIVDTYKNKTLFRTSYSSSTYQNVSLDKNTTLSIRINRIMKSINSTLFLLRAPMAISYVKNNFASNLSLWDLLVLSIELKNVRTSSPLIAHLNPARRSSSTKSEFNTADMLVQLLNKKAMHHKRQDPLRVDVWNASGKQKLAENVTWLLRKQGYDVVDFGTYASQQPITFVKDYSDNYDESYSIIKFLNCGEIIATYQPGRFVDISVILGKDCSRE